MSQECYICNDSVQHKDYFIIGQDYQFGFGGHPVCERCYNIHNLDCEKHGMTVVEEIADNITKEGK